MADMPMCEREKAITHEASAESSADGANERERWGAHLGSCSDLTIFGNEHCPQCLWTECRSVTKPKLPEHCSTRA